MAILKSDISLRVQKDVTLILLFWNLSREKQKFFGDAFNLRPLFEALVTLWLTCDLIIKFLLSLYFALNPVKNGNNFQDGFSLFFPPYKYVHKHYKIIFFFFLNSILYLQKKQILGEIYIYILYKYMYENALAEAPLIKLTPKTLFS